MTFELTIIPLLPPEFWNYKGVPLTPVRFRDWRASACPVEGLKWIREVDTLGPWRASISYTFSCVTHRRTIWGKWAVAHNLSSWHHPLAVIRSFCACGPLVAKSIWVVTHWPDAVCQWVLRLDTGTQTTLPSSVVPVKPPPLGCVRITKEQRDKKPDLASPSIAVHGHVVITELVNHWVLYGCIVLFK